MFYELAHLYQNENFYGRLRSSKQINNRIAKKQNTRSFRNKLMTPADCK